MDHLFWVALLGIVWVDLLLSGDNALVIAMVSRQLPKDQQKWGIIGGTAVAILLRVVMATVANSLLDVPALGILGGAYLLWVAIKLIIVNDDDVSEKPVTTLWSAITTIAIADATMSTDNVMAIAALAHGHVGLMAIGVLLSIPLVIAGSAIISMMIERFPALKWAGAALLGWVAGGIIGSDPWYPWPWGPNAFTGLMIVVTAGWIVHLYRQIDKAKEVPTV
ncbi:MULTISPECIES: TerC family protein [unclassified Bradyrhizobium]|uniref:TerC family protein n=1 Tax=unclassified Bradyrhizobium TaxID=2631580 RepID=UPI0028EDACDF|nr:MULTISPECIES: TerC family protein [unclassified Bradyrhizobium]